MEAEEGSDQKPDILPHCLAAHACLKNDFAEDGKSHNLMRWLSYRMLTFLQWTVDTGRGSRKAVPDSEISRLQTVGLPWQPPSGGRSVLLSYAYHSYPWKHQVSRTSEQFPQVSIFERKKKEIPQ